MSLDKPRILCFDLDNTLWPVDSVIRYAEEQLHLWLIRYYPSLASRFSPVKMRRLREKLLQAQPHLKADVTALRKQSMAQAARLCGYDESLVEPAFAVFMKARHRIKLYHDVLPVLTRLKTQYTLCTLTNGNADVHRITELSILFEMTLSAGEVGQPKPHPAIFAALCERLGAKPAEVVHIGDDMITDVGGALAAGMRAVWLNRERRTSKSEYIPHANIHSLNELESILIKWQS